MSGRRISTRVVEDAGDVIRDVNLIDVSASETIVGAPHDPTSALSWKPAGEAFSHASFFLFRVKHLRSTAGSAIHTYQYETILGRLARVYPRSVLATAQEITNVLTGTPLPSATITQCLHYALLQWKVDFPWLDWEALPTLRVQTSTGFVTPSVPALALRQGDNPASARALIEQMLSLFTGYVLRANDSKLQLVAPPTTVAKSITNDQVYSIEPGAQLDDIVNRCTVRSQQWAYETAEYAEPVTISLAADQANVFNYVDGTGNRDGYRHVATELEGEGGTWYDVELHPDVMAGLTGRVYIDVRLEAIKRTYDTVDGWVNTSNRTNPGQFQEIILTETANAGDSTIRVSPLEHALPGNTTLYFANGATVRLTISSAPAGSTTLNLTDSPSAEIPRGTVALHSTREWLLSNPGFNVASASQSGGPTFTLRVAPGTTPNTIRLRWSVDGPLSDIHSPLQDEDYYYGVRAVLRFYAYNYGPTRSRLTTTFGRVDNPEDVSKQPGIITSQTNYGVVERTVDAGFTNLDTADALAIAEAYVAANMQPRERIVLEMRADQPIKPSDINTRINLPGGGTGIVEAWEHSESFGNTTAAISTRVTVAGDLDEPEPYELVTGAGDNIGFGSNVTPLGAVEVLGQTPPRG